jgi:cytochrome d ubiquinol oxidase subunit I
MVLAAYLTTAFVVGAVGAWHLLRKGPNAKPRKMFSMAMWMAAIVAPMQIFAGDLHGINTLEHQPAKVAAMEGHYERHPRRAADPVRQCLTSKPRRTALRSASPACPLSS